MSFLSRKLFKVGSFSYSLKDLALDAGITAVSVLATPFTGGGSLAAGAAAIAGRRAAVSGVRAVSSRLGIRAAREQKAINEAIDGIARASITITAVAAEQVSKRGLFERLVLGHLKTGLVLGVGATALVGIEFFTNGAISKAAPGVISDIASKLREISPKLADAVKEHGMAALEGLVELSEVDRQAAINIVAGSFEEAGQQDMANATRIYGALMSLSLPTKLAGAEAGERGQVVLRHLRDNAGVSDEQIAQYLLLHPQQARQAEEQLQINFQSEIPSYAQALRAEVPAATATDPLDTATGQVTAADPGRAFTDVASRVESGDLKLNVIDRVLFELAEAGARLLHAFNFGGWADGMVERLQNFAVARATGQLVGQGNLGIVANIPGFEPSGRTPEPTQPGVQPG